MRVTVSRLVIMKLPAAPIISVTTNARNLPVISSSKAPIARKPTTPIRQWASSVFPKPVKYSCSTFNPYGIYNLSFSNSIPLSKIIYQQLFQREDELSNYQHYYGILNALFIPRRFIIFVRKPDGTEDNPHYYSC